MKKEARLDLDAIRVDPPKTSMSREEVIRWYDALIEQKQRVEATLAMRSAEAKVYQQECLSRGRAGRQDWFDFDAEEAVWRAKARGFLNVVEKHLRRAKALLRELKPTPSTPPQEKIDKKRRNRAVAAVVQAAELCVDSDGEEEDMERLREAVRALRILQIEQLRAESE